MSACKRRRKPSCVAEQPVPVLQQQRRLRGRPRKGESPHIINPTRFDASLPLPIIFIDKTKTSPRKNNTDVNNNEIVVPESKETTCGEISDRKRCYTKPVGLIQDQLVKEVTVEYDLDSEDEQFMHELGENVDRLEATLDELTKLRPRTFWTALKNLPTLQCYSRDKAETIYKHWLDKKQRRPKMRKLSAYKCFRPVPPKTPSPKTRAGRLADAEEKLALFNEVVEKRQVLVKLQRNAKMWVRQLTRKSRKLQTGLRQVEESWELIQETSNDNDVVEEEELQRFKNYRPTPEREQFDRLRFRDSEDDEDV